MKYKYLKILFYISLIFCFLQNFVIFIVPNTNANIPIGLFFWIPLFGCCLFNYNKFLKLLKIHVYRAFLAFILVMMIISIVHFLLGRYTGPTAFYFTRWYKFVISCFIVYLLPCTSLLFKIKIRDIIKSITYIIYFIFVLGIINYIGLLLNNNFIILFFQKITNMTGGISETHVMAYKNLLRVYSVFSEPSVFGQFLFIILPIVFKISTSVYKITNNVIVDIFIKKTILPFLFLNLVFTKSPIFLILCIIEFILILIILNIKYLKKYLPMIIVSITISIILGYMFLYNLDIDVEYTYLGRISKVIYSLGDFYYFVRMEPNLATRIVAYMQQMRVFLDNPIFGCGQYNIEATLNSIFLDFKLPITTENFIGYSAHPSLAGVNRSLFWSMLAETGIVGICLYEYFVYLNLKYINKIKYYFHGIEYDFLVGLFLSVIATIVISFYNLVFENYILWIFYGLVLLYINNAYYSKIGVTRNE